MTPKTDAEYIDQADETAGPQIEGSIKNTIMITIKLKLLALPMEVLLEPKKARIALLDVL